MLVEFNVGNFRSIRDRQTLSLEATTLKSSPEWSFLDEGNAVPSPSGLRLLTSTVIYGANASGKSNLIKALLAFQTAIVASSLHGWQQAALLAEPFLLSEATESGPSYFEGVFDLKEGRYRYGFEADGTSIVREWLFEWGTTKERTLFLREGTTFDVKGRYFKEGVGISERTRPGTLFLSVCAAFNGPHSGALVQSLQHSLITSGLTDRHYGTSTDALMRHPVWSQRIVDTVREMDLSIQDVRLNQVTSRMEAHHTKYSLEGAHAGTISWDLNRHESDGTQKLFHLSGAILACLDVGSLLVIDELDARLHPKMTCDLVRLFGDPKTNPHGAQLIFTTHDTNLLSSHLFRRDQIWFVEKDASEGSHVFSLAEYKLNNGTKARNDGNWEKEYISGKFGAIPFPGDIHGVVAEAVSTATEGATDVIAKDRNLESTFPEAG